MSINLVEERPREQTRAFPTDGQCPSLSRVPMFIRQCLNSWVRLLLLRECIVVDTVIGCVRVYLCVCVCVRVGVCVCVCVRARVRV